MNTIPLASCNEISCGANTKTHEMWEIKAFDQIDRRDEIWSRNVCRAHLMERFTDYQHYVLVIRCIAKGVTTRG